MGRKRLRRLRPGRFLAIPLFLVLANTAHAAVPDISTQTSYDFSAQLKTKESLLEEDPLNTELVVAVADLRLLTTGHVATREWLQSFLMKSQFLAPTEHTHRIQEKLLNVLSRFRLEEAQSLYFRGEMQKKNGDYTAALGLFTQALRTEPDNLSLLKEKMFTEFHLGLYPAYYDTLTALYGITPFQRELRIQLGEAHLKFKAYAKVIDLMESRPVGRTAREDLALAIAYYESGKKEQALGLLRTLPARSRDGATQFVVTYYLGKAYFDSDHLNLARWNWLRSQRSARHLPSLRWDPYDLAGKSQNLPNLISELGDPDAR